MRRKPTHMPTGRLKSLRLFSTLLAVTFFDKQRSFRPQAHGLGNLPAILACFEVDGRLQQCSAAKALLGRTSSARLNPWLIRTVHGSTQPLRCRTRRDIL